MFGEGPCACIANLHEHGELTLQTTLHSSSRRSKHTYGGWPNIQIDCLGMHPFPALRVVLALSPFQGDSPLGSYRCFAWAMQGIRNV